MLGSEAVSPGTHRRIVDQAAGIDIGQSLQRQPPEFFRAFRISAIRLLGEAMLAFRLGFGRGGFGWSGRGDVHAAHDNQGIGQIPRGRRERAFTFTRPVNGV